MRIDLYARTYGIYLFFSQSQLGRLLLRVHGRSVLFPTPHYNAQPLPLLISKRDALEA